MSLNFKTHPISYAAALSCTKDAHFSSSLSASVAQFKQLETNPWLRASRSVGIDPRVTRHCRVTSTCRDHDRRSWCPSFSHLWREITDPAISLWDPPRGTQPKNLCRCVLSSALLRSLNLSDQIRSERGNVDGPDRAASTTFAWHGVVLVFCWSCGLIIF